MKKLLLIILTLSLPATALAWPWSRDLMNQPSIKPQEQIVKPYPLNIVPTTGLWTKVADRDETEELVNPIPASKESLAIGRALFRTLCLPCHGATGMGNGPVGLIMEVPPVDLRSDYVKEDLTDGWIWGTITFGGFVMPRYGYDLNPEERWDIVNYVRHGLANEPVDETASDDAQQGGE